MRGFDALFHVVEIGPFLEFAKFLLDSLHLFVQVILALALLHLAFDASADALFHLQDIEFTFDQRQQVLKPFPGGKHLEHLLFLLEFQGQMSRDRIGKPARFVYAGQRGEDLWRDFLVQLYVLVELRNQRAAHGLDFCRDLVVRGNRCCLDRKVGGRIKYLVDMRALTALDQHFDGAVGQFQHLQDIGERADRVQVFGRRFVLGGRFLRNQHDAFAGFHRAFERLDRFGPPDKKRNDHMREYHHVAQGQQRQLHHIRQLVICSGHVVSPE